MDQSQRNSASSGRSGSTRIGRSGSGRESRRRLTDVRDDLLGDIRLLRNDIVHHGGIATKANSGRCKILQWFNDGDPT